MQQIFIEMWSFKDSWRALTMEQRGAYLDKLGPVIQEMQAHGMEIIAWCYNDAKIDRRANYDVFGVYRLPNRAVLDKLQSVIAASGWYEYFEQANVGGAALTPPGILFDHAMLNSAPIFEDISPDERGERRSVKVNGLNLSTLQLGSGKPVVFLHGEIGQAYMWRNVLPHVAANRRAIALDQIGQGQSDKLPSSHDGAYSFDVQYRHFDATMKALGIERDVILVGQDWGCNLAFEWAKNNPNAVAGVAYCEPVTPPFEWSDWTPMIQPLFRTMFSDAGEEFQIANNGFVGSLPMGVLRSLSSKEVATYQAPYAAVGEARRPPLDWAREVPLGGRKPEMKARIEAHSEFMAKSAIPKLLLRGQPGALSNDRRYDLLHAWRNQEEVAVRGIHWLPEDDPHTMGRALAAWIARIDAAK